MQIKTARPSPKPKSAKPVLPDFGAASSLLRWLAQERQLGGAFLLSGPHQNQLKAPLQLWLQRLMCEALSADSAPCGRCAGCVDVARQQHLDVRVLKPEDEDKKRPEIKVAALRQVLDEFVWRSSHGGRRRVLVLWQAHLLNVAGQNVLLKTLEEPPQQVAMLLVSEHSQSLNLTLRSRCRQFRLPRSYLWQAEAPVELLVPSQLALAQAHGDPEQAWVLGQDERYQQQHRRLLDYLGRPQGSAWGTASQWAVPVGAKERAEFYVRHFDWLSDWVVDVLLCCRGQAPRYHPQHQERLNQLAATARPAQLLALFDDLQQQRRHAAHPLDARLFWPEMLERYHHASGG